MRSDAWRRERLKEAKEKRETVADQIAASKFSEILGGDTPRFSDPTSAKVVKLEELDKFINENERLVAAVDAAYANVGKHYKWEVHREMCDAFRLNFENPKKYPWQTLDYGKGRKHETVSKFV
jgi:hypothetical protein